MGMHMSCLLEPNWYLGINKQLRPYEFQRTRGADEDDDDDDDDEELRYWYFIFAEGRCESWSRMDSWFLDPRIDE